MDYLALLESRINAETDTLQNLHNSRNGGIDGFVGSSFQPIQKNTSDRKRELFRYHGIPDDDAQVLAERLIRRDEQHDDRRSCAECANYAPKSCRAAATSLGTVSIFSLSRCPEFDDALYQNGQPL